MAPVITHSSLWPVSSQCGTERSGRLPEGGEPLRCAFKLQWNPSGGVAGCRIIVSVRSLRWRDLLCIIAVDEIWCFSDGSGCFFIRMKREEQHKRLEARLTMRCHGVAFALHLILLPVTGKKTSPTSQKSLKCLLQVAGGVCVIWKITSTVYILMVPCSSEHGSRWVYNDGMLLNFIRSSVIFLQTLPLCRMKMRLYYINYCPALYLCRHLRSFYSPWVS